jgi:hypothetical protein
MIISQNVLCESVDGSCRLCDDRCGMLLCMCESGTVTFYCLH